MYDIQDLKHKKSLNILHAKKLRMQFPNVCEPFLPYRAPALEAGCSLAQTEHDNSRANHAGFLLPRT